MATRKKTILLVEDNPDDALLTLRAFGKSSVAHEITVVEDGADALDYLFAAGQYAERAALPDVVLLDLNLPRMSGLQVLQKIRADQRTRRLPVVVLTTSNAERDVLRSYDLGANSFVRKPVDFTKFIDAAQQLGVYWLEVNEAPSG
jgi:CheY-like chemotaxis protein